MAGKFTQLALLTAGLFLSTKSFAADECSSRAGDTIPLLEFGVSFCPVLSSWTISGVRCELVQLGDQICALTPGDSTYSGGPYVYTGGIADPDTQAPIQPPDEQPDPTILPPLTPVRPIDWQDPNLNNNGEAVNSNLVKLSESFKTLSDSLNNTIRDSAANQQNISARVDRVNSDLRAAMSFNTNQTARQIQTLQSSLNSSQASIEDNDDDNFQTLYDQAERHNEVAVRAVSDIKQQANQIEALSWQLESVMGTVTTSNNYLQETLPQMALANFDGFGEVIGGIGVLEQRLDSLNTGGSGGSDMTVTNNLIRETIGNIQGVQSSINTVGMYTSRTADGLQDLSYALADLNSNNLEQLWEVQDLRTDLNSQLSGIKTAIENGTGGGSDDDTQTNQKLDGLGQKLDGIGQGIDDISDALKPGSGQKNGPSTCEGKDCWKAASWIESSYPDGVAGLWAERKDAFDRSGMKQYLNSLVPQIGGNGGLKPFELCFDMGFAHYGCHTFTIPPYVIAFIRLCVLITAGFYCQRLVFGGA